jgi:hypothetical protein
MGPAGHPIIYVRGYAMTEDERNETAADPFCGLNVGSTVYRANIDKSTPAKKFVFESPVLRLAADFGYRTVYENGLDILDPDWKPRTGADGVRVPDYQVEKVFWPDQHYEGGYLFRDTAIVEMVPPSAAGGDWSLKYSWQSDSIGVAATEMSYRRLKEGKVQVQIPFDSGGKPGISGKVRLVIGAWNT